MKHDHNAAYAVHMMGIAVCMDDRDLEFERRSIRASDLLRLDEKQRLLAMVDDRAGYLEWKRGKSDQEQIRLQLEEEADPPEQDLDLSYLDTDYLADASDLEGADE